MGGVFFPQNFKMALDTQENEVTSSENFSEKTSIPLSDYANRLEPKVKNFQPDCLPPVESMNLLFYLVLETSYRTTQNSHLKHFEASS